MRWNLQVPTAARAAPPSGACPAPSPPACSRRPAPAAGPRAPRAGWEPGLGDAEAAVPAARCGRGLPLGAGPVAAARAAEERKQQPPRHRGDPAGAENGGGFGGAKWRRDP